MQKKYGLVDSFKVQWTVNQSLGYIYRCRLINDLFFVFFTQRNLNFSIELLKIQRIAAEKTHVGIIFMSMRFRFHDERLGNRAHSKRKLEFSHFLTLTMEQIG